MSVAFDPDHLPAALRPLVERALREREGHDLALEAIAEHLAGGGARTPDLLVALATLTYDDAASVVLHRLGDAAEQALVLLEEAAAQRGSRQGLERLFAAFRAAREAEAARAQRLRTLLVQDRRARATELAELAARALAASQDATAMALLREAAARATLEDEELPQEVAEAG